MVIVIKDLQPLKELEIKVISCLLISFCELWLDGVSEPDHELCIPYPLRMLLLDHRVSTASHTKSDIHIECSS